MDIKDKKKSDKHRITIDVEQDFNSRLEKLLDIIEADSKADLIRQALRVYEYIATKTEAGASFKLVHPDGEVEKLVFLAF
jgi:hypothetical protein